MGKFTKRLICVVSILFFVCALFVCLQTPFVSIFSMPSTINLSLDEIENLSNYNQFGPFIKIESSGDTEAVVGGKINLTAKVKLLNFITLKTLNINTDNVELYAGGDIVGFSLNSDGVVIISSSKVKGLDGDIDTLSDSNIKRGDIIKKIENTPIKSVADICRVVNKEENKNRNLNIEVLRKGERVITKIKNVYDVNSRLYKLGLWVKDDASGIGTLTYIKKDDLRFGALGHAICDNDTKTVFDVEDGEMYKCTIIGLRKGVKGKAGEIKGLFMQGKKNLGIVDNNCDCGVFGTANSESDILSEKEVLKAGGRMYAKPGKAFIRSSIDGKTTKDYEIEIVKTNYQSTKNEKSMVIRVTDKELLQKTGGIIQGMSGSPIIQNGRIIGAITHVFINDPTKGFGIYLDWMLNQ